MVRDESAAAEDEEDAQWASTPGSRWVPAAELTHCLDATGVAQLGSTLTGRVWQWDALSR